MKRTFQPSLLVRKRRHGFLNRLKNSLHTLKRRMHKGRYQISA